MEASFVALSGLDRRDRMVPLVLQGQQGLVEKLDLVDQEAKLDRLDLQDLPDRVGSQDLVVNPEVMGLPVL